MATKQGAFTDWRRALTSLAWLAVVAGASALVGVGLHLGAVAYGIGLWWALVSGVTVAGMFASTVFWLGDMKTWRDDAVLWTSIAIDVTGFLGTLAYGCGVLYAVARLRGWM